jgi:DNA-binding PadR family transcriptional regulator
MRHRNRGPFEGVGQGRGRSGGRDESGGQPEPFGQNRPHSHRDREGHGRRGGPGRGRAQRGDVRTAILQVVADEPMHGYQIMQTMRDRTGGAWRPSPGAVYPTIAQLEDEGLVTTREEGGRRLVTLTAEGTAYLEERSARLGDPFADFAEGTPGPDLRDPLHELQAAARQIAVGGDSAQLEAAAKVLAQARRSLYLILAGEPEKADE